MMPRKAKPPYASPVPADLQNLPFSGSNERLISREAWEEKNARAKSIIMSTLVPGSEAWKLAEPMAYAQDIWKALEGKYGPKDGTTQMWQPGTPWVESDRVKEAAQELEQDETTRAELERRKESVIKSWAEQNAVKARMNEVGTIEVDTPDTKSEARVTEELDLPKTRTCFNAQDKRFLWALLNGGKDSHNPSTMENLELHKGDPKSIEPARRMRELWRREASLSAAEDLEYAEEVLKNTSISNDTSRSPMPTPGVSSKQERPPVDGAL